MSNFYGNSIPAQCDIQLQWDAVLENHYWKFDLILISG